MQALRPIIDSWTRLSRREQGLAMAVVGLLAAFVVVIAVQRALATLDGLDRDIDRLQSDIVNFSYQIARRQSVEARYAQVARQHSSAWTESEIRDRLRQEIYRLGNYVPPELDDNGIPVSTGNDGRQLVSIPELRGGRLEAGGEGYREFRMDFSVRPAPFLDMVAYLERLRESPQSLRIDHIDMRRDPMRPEVSAELGITRIVVDDPAAQPDGTLQAEQHDTMRLVPTDWSCDGCTVAPAQDGPDADALIFRGGDGGGSTRMVRSLPAGAAYDVSVDVASTSDGRLGVQVDGTPLPVTGDTALRKDGKYYRYHFQFALPQGHGARVSTGFPVLSWTAPKSVVKVRNLSVAQAGEGSHAS